MSDARPDRAQEIEWVLGLIAHELSPALGVRESNPVFAIPRLHAVLKHCQSLLAAGVAAGAARPPTSERIVALAQRVTCSEVHDGTLCAPCRVDGAGCLRAWAVNGEWPDVAASRPPQPENAWTEGGAIDIAGCPLRWGGRGACRCVPACAVCGYGPHMSVHGPVLGAPIGSRPWGHVYQPEPVSAARHRPQTTEAMRLESVVTGFEALIAAGYHLHGPDDEALDKQQFIDAMLLAGNAALALPIPDDLSRPRPQEGHVLSLHRCRFCGTRWLLWPDSVHGGGWNLLDGLQRPGSCCNNVAMGNQIEHLRDLPLQVGAASPPPQEPDK